MPGTTTTTWLRRVALVAGAAAAVALLASCHAPKSYDVNSVVDEVDANPGDGTCATANDECTLRAAIQEADAMKANATINLPAEHYVLSIAGANEDAGATGDLDVTTPITIIGNGATIDANHLDRAFDIPGSAATDSSLRLDHVTITGGTAEFGGALHAGVGTLTLVFSTVDGNHATGSGTCGGSGPCAGTPLGGGGINSVQPVTLTDATISNNTADGLGAGGVSGPVVAADSTISGNTATHGGVGGIVGASTSAPPPQPSSLSHVTVAGNTGSVASSLSGNITLSGTAVSGSSPACASTHSSGYSAATDGSCGLINATDHPSQPIPLTILGLHGGPTAVHLPKLGGAIIDAIPTGTAGLCDTGTQDQRGQSRPLGPGCEIGSVEGDTGVPGAGAQFTVTDRTDDPDANPSDGHCATAAGTCSLRAAIMQVNLFHGFANTVTIAPNPITYIQRTANGPNEDDGATGDLDIGVDLTIHGNGTNVYGSFQADRVFDIGVNGSAPTVTLDGLSIQQGLVTDAGGGVLIRNGHVTIIDSTIGDNAAIKGGGIAIQGGTLDLERTAITGNLADTNGTGHYGGGLYATGGSTVTGTNVLFDTSSTFDSGGRGGNIAEDGAQVVLNYATVFNGISALGGNVWASSAGFVHFGASILQNPTSTNCFGFTGSTGYNLVSDTSCPFFTNPTDIVNTTAGITNTHFNGGPTETMRPPAGSVAITHPVPTGTAGLCDTSFPGTDQRGAPRPAGAVCDRGSFQLQASHTYTVNTAADTHDTDPGDGVCTTADGTGSLRAAIDEANTWIDPDTITIAAGVNPTLTLAGTAEAGNANGDLDLLSEVTLHGNGATVAAGPSGRVLDQRGGSLTVDHLTFAGGHDADGGDVQIISGQATFDHTTIRDGHASSSGGGLEAATGTTVVIDSSTIRDNVASTLGGGISNDFGQTTITRSTLSGNQVTDPTNGAGGAISSSDPGFNDPTEITTITQSTLSGNHAGARGGAVSGRFVMSYVTVAANTAGDGSSLDAGGFSSSSLGITDSLLSGGSPLCSSDTTVGKTGNDFSDTSCQLNDPTAVAAPPHLGPLTDNGGSTLTHLPFADSPGVDSLPLVGGACPDGAAGDQRGVTRPQGSQCDAGAVERQPSDP